MTIAKKIAAWGGKPYKARLEYLQSTGTQWIDTGIILGQNCRFVSRVAYTARSGSVDVWIASVRTPNYHFTLAQGNRQYTTLTIGYYTQYIGSPDGSFNANTFYDVDARFAVGSQQVYINGVLTASLDISENYSAEATMPLFARKHTTNGMIPSPNPVMMGKTEMYSNGSLVRSFIPVLDFSDVPCMYDEVSKQFFYNAGSGSFTAGPEAVGGGYKLTWPPRSHRRSSRPSARFWRTPRTSQWKEVA